MKLLRHGAQLLQQAMNFSDQLLRNALIRKESFLCQEAALTAVLYSERNHIMNSITEKIR